MKMIKNERLDKIMEILEKEQYSTPDTLASQLFVSPVTIRRDLKKLEQDGLVSTCYGGVSIANNKLDVPLSLRENFNKDIKTTLAKKAAELIPNNSTVFLDSSSTVSRMAHFLRPEQNITVITNGIKALEILSRNHIKTYSTGGKIVDNSFALVGALAIKSIKSVYADFMFFSSQGIDESGNITDSSEDVTELLQIMLEYSDKHYYLCDNSKIGKRFMLRICNYSELDGVLCDIPLPFARQSEEIS